MDRGDCRRSRNEDQYGSESAGRLCGAPVERVMDQFQQFLDVERFQ